MPRAMPGEYWEDQDSDNYRRATPPPLPRSLRVGPGPASMPSSQDLNDSDYPDESPFGDDVGPGDSYSDINGMEPALPHRAGKEPGNELVRRRKSHRHHGALKASKDLWEDLAIKSMPPENTDCMVKLLEKHADGRLRRTYLEGRALNDVDDTAMTLSVGLTFLSGTDKPKVNRLEQDFMNNKEPDQKDAAWRVNTAGALLLQFEVSPDLSIMQTDQTSEVVSKAKGRLQKHDVYLSEQRRSLIPRGRQDAVTIDSECVKIVNDLRGGTWDLQGLLIEVDGFSLWNLIINYKYLISRGGPEMTFEETSELLETMIEDARRLCIRSPILFRMTTRSRIINSENTRYGTDGGPAFRTLTTSKGIKEIISLSASYYNSLDPTGGDNAVQRFIRPRFLQMIVLLLSLLNNTDLLELQDFLESTYKLKADRRNLEMLFLKVIPLLSINPRVFLKALVPATEGFPLSSNRDEDHDHIWNVFVKRILKNGYLLPGTIDDLGRECLSWLYKWPQDGLKSTTVFDNLQYQGRLRTINHIPPIQIHPGASTEEITVIMTDLSQYTISSEDLERITCLTPGIYSIREAGVGNRNYDLNIEDTEINGELQDAISKTNTIIQDVNRWLATTGPKPSVKSRLLRPNRVEPMFFNEYKGSGRLTRNVAILNHGRLAIAYKVEGKKISRTDCVRNMARDISALRLQVRQIEARSSTMDHKSLAREKRALKVALEEAKAQITLADQSRVDINDFEDISEEPIAKVLYDERASGREPVIWNDYKAWCQETSGLLRVEGKLSSVSSVRWLTDDMIELSLNQHSARIYASPLKPVEEGFRDDEVRVGDIAMLVGQYVIIAEADEYSNDPEAGYLMTNYLRVTNIEDEVRTKRGANRARKSDSRVTCCFR